ncbi:hypothetical protein [Paraburkholderia sp. JHI869]|uniref:hypothetical protein n=1 Tax=Paraburkholderia sp. JHI869 TaxID=3112959 RepID=UPI00316E8368
MRCLPEYPPRGRACSLLYHLLALSECSSPDTGVSLKNIELIENYLYSLAPLTSDWTQPDIAVLANQYRPARRTGHQQHADMAFSRLGIARNGDTEAQYDAAIRCFVPHVKRKVVNKIKDKTEESFENEPEPVRVLEPHLRQLPVNHLARAVMLRLNGGEYVRLFL